MTAPIVSRILQHAVVFSHKPAIITEEQQITYEHLQGKIFSAAAELSGKGILHGDRVVLAASNSPSFIYGYFGAHLIGAIVVPVDPNTPDSRLRYIIDRVDPKAIFTVRPFKHDSISVRSINDLENLPYRKIRYKIPDLPDLADILFTTGTTGDPKGVVLTHGNIFHAATNINAFIKNTSEDKEVVPLPLSHSFGLGRLRCKMLAGGTIILTQGFTFPGTIFQAIERWKATGLSFVPAGWAILLRLDGEKIGDYSSHLRYIEIGSAPMPLEHKKLLIRLLPKTRICMHYGLTEASRSTFLEFHESKDKITSIGKAAPNVEIKIIGENDEDLPPFQSGKIMVRGGTVMKEYWRNQGIRENYFINGWFYTGDIGHRDGEGYFYLDGREEDMINVGGHNVSPAEVENILVQHESIESCACIGIPDPNGITGEAVKAYLVSSKGTKMPRLKDILSFLQGKIELYKMPVAIEWVDKLPQISSGKVQRNVLRQKNDSQVTFNNRK